jgi:deaminated glutathione amidase
MRAAVIQMCSQEDVKANLDRATQLVAGAAAQGAQLIALPENFAFMGEEGTKREIAERIEEGERSGPITRAVLHLAKSQLVWIVAGGMPEASSDPARPYNTSLLVSPDGRIAGRYRKVHLFDIDLPDGTKHMESAATFPGELAVSVHEITTMRGGFHRGDEGGGGYQDVTEAAQLETATLGMSVCYDLRFPELYRKLVAEGARIVTVPAAFTLTTGKDHWHVLLRARAIENQVFVLAPAQHGKHPRGRQTYGKSLIVDPWGDVLAQCPEGEGFAIANLDFAAQDRVRASLPCLSHRRI